MWLNVILSCNLIAANLGNEEEAKKITAQNFQYLAEGGQTEVFASEDGKYVLKLFKNHPNKWIPFPKYHARKLKKLRRDLNGYKLAFEALPEESCLIFCHLAKTPFPAVTLMDQLGKTQTIDLGGVEFIIQKRAEPFCHYFHQHPSREALNALKGLLQHIAEKKIHDHDPRFHKNIGFLDGKAVLIDPGRLVEDPEAHAKFTPKFREWIKNNHPEFESEVQ